MNRVKQRKFNNLYWTYTVVTICMLVLSSFEWRTIIGAFLIITGITFNIFDERGKFAFPDNEEDIEGV